MQMLSKLVEYLKSNGVPFRLFSFPSPEPEPPVLHPMHPEGALTLETHVLLIDTRPALVCVARGDKINVPGLRATIPAEIIAVPGDVEAPPSPDMQSIHPVPPLGRLFDMPLFVDQAVTMAPVICFEAFATTDFVEMTYADFARLEQPRVAAIAIAGELPAQAMH